MMRAIRNALVVGAVCALVCPIFAWADDDATEAPARVTFTKDILPILQENCQVCHRPGGDSIAGVGAPMSLISYEETRPWAKSMAEKVKSREMPPWDATDLTKGQFINERTLEPEQIDAIVRWVESGAPRGNPADAPEPKEFTVTDGWVIGIPDFEIYITEPYWVADDVTDIQPSFTMTITEEMLPEPRWIKAVECRPGSPLVHHTFSTAIAPAIEGHPEETFALASAAAGEDPQQYPDGFGNLLRAGTKVHISMHYNKEPGPGTGMWDRSGLGFKFYPKGTEPKRKVHWGGAGGGRSAVFEIPPRHPNWEVGASGIMEYDSLLLSVHPHMHYRGRDFKYVAYYPDGTNETLIHVDRFDFAWQTIYFYKEPKFVPAGTRIESTAIYDNSESAKAIWPAIDIDRAISFGAASTDEMMIPYISWAHVNAEDDEVYRGDRLAVRLERERQRAEFEATRAAEEERDLSAEELEQQAAQQ